MITNTSIGIIHMMEIREAGWERGRLTNWRVHALSKVSRDKK